MCRNEKLATDLPSGWQVHGLNTKILLLICESVAMYFWIQKADPVNELPSQLNAKYLHQFPFRKLTYEIHPRWVFSSFLWFQYQFHTNRAISFWYLY